MRHIYYLKFYRTKKIKQQIHIYKEQIKKYEKLLEVAKSKLNGRRVDG